MTEQELRTLVRDAIARHAGPSRSDEPPPPGAAAGCRTHASHGLFVLPAGAEGACLIEPAVMCNHCGYCKSYGH